MSSEMSAYVIEEFGDPDVFERTTVDVPEPGPDEIRVEVVASSVNPVDYKIRQGAIPDFAPDFPARLHCDVAGVVDAVGDEVDAFDEGDEVYGMPGGAGRQGALADYVVGHAGTFARAPESLPLADAAALPVVALTAWEMLADKTTVDDGDDVIVYGASGGVGHIGVQIADHFDTAVTATGSSEEKRELAERLGADATVDYTATDVEEYVAEHAGGTGFDVVFDPIGDDHLETAFEAVRPYGSVVTTESSAAQDVDLAPMHENSLELGVVLVILPVLLGDRQERIGEELAEIADLVDDGAVEPHIDDRYSFDEVAEAHRRAETGDFLGKLLLVNE
ncbi:Alcohol dehydrogenase zinc-binding domain protein [Haloterrigena turkmenica DSM 5511]|uniref:Alcohol dehydrogenase zinc-binding domain protein n=1 Tax=Haloterrigena turkmenica (strain ATCC 51198 / DSM 5511 / JCM 9101 / NCIMB 13204 / VKM B-1734 / 4k) TaxID=543526 RepID=D2RV79_HALTV|nr:zinc-binding dehydrogenase [Haloterrigena turkmenica]ADB61280.1 Alcohol dehydrogenase zinc-binding domain protein [Haloterrigena turkmenica DSM 5511]